MSIFAIADLHLSTGAGIDKSMEVFGKRWRGYTERYAETGRRRSVQMTQWSSPATSPGRCGWRMHCPIWNF